MPKLTFCTQSSRAADNVEYSPERLINLYPEGGPQDAKAPLLLRSVLGQEAFADLGIGVLRAMEEINGVIYAVGSGSLFSVSSDGTVSNLGVIDDDPVTTISGNGDNVTIAANGKYYVWDGATLTQPTPGAFSNFGTVTFIDQRTIITERDGARFQWSEVGDPTDLDALDFASNESRNDNTLRVLADRRELWFFGEQSIEIWYNTGQGGADAFTRLNGGALDTGCLAASLSVKFDEGIFFIGDDRIAYITNGLGINQISTGAVEQALSVSVPTHCFYYEDRGHKFFCIRFDDRPAWCFDLATGLWHERSTGVNKGAWEVVDTVKAFGQWYCGTSDGQIREMKRNNVDVGNALRRTAVSRSMYMAGDQFAVSEMEFLARKGESNIGRDAQVMMRVSDDGGRTFSVEDWRSLGDQGDRNIYMVYRALGTYRDFVAEFTITDPADISMYSDLNVRVS